MRYFRSATTRMSTRASVWAVRDDGMEKCLRSSISGDTFVGEYEEFTDCIEGDTSILDMCRNGDMVELTEDDAFLEMI
jgi:hypothetical protein